jgi:hypothetical protein
MKWGFDNVAHNHAVTTSTDALRDQALQRLHGVYKKLDSKGISASFSRAARAGGDAVGDMGLIGGLIANMAMWAPFFDALAQTFEAPVGELGGFDMMRDSTLMAALDGLCMYRDDKVQGSRTRVLYDYPEGRRRDPILDQPLNKKFNLVSSNDNARFGYDTEAEIACLFEILDTLDALQRQGVSLLQLDQKEPVYDAMKRMQDGLFARQTVSRFASPLRKAV